MNGIEEREVDMIAKFTPEEQREYEDSLKTYRDLKNSLDTAEEKGRNEGRAEEKYHCHSFSTKVEPVLEEISPISSYR